jgi:xanthine dehydrogenase YagR molybdenum-binding subunit
MSPSLGLPVARRDGPLKVTGGARYSAEIELPGLTHAALVGATIASGRVTAVDASEALAADGVLAVITHEDLPRLNEPHLVPSLLGGPAPGQSFSPLQGDEIHYAGQPVAIVVAQTHEQAQWAARRVKVSYEPTRSRTTIDEGRDDIYEPERIFAGFIPARMSRGDVDGSLAAAEVTIEREWKFAANHHNAIEPPATTAVWNGDELTLWDAAQGVTASQLTVCALLGISPSKVRVIGRYVGGGFGSKAMVWPHVTLAALAARHVRRPVRLSLTRAQMFVSCGHREEQELGIALGATRDGRVTAVRGHKLSMGSPFDDWAEPAWGATSASYLSGSFEGVHRIVRGNTMTPTFTRGPGETVGSFPMEVALDELAYELGLDPIELRLRNIGPTDGNTGFAWSSDGREECFRRGAERFGWAHRDARPRSRREGDWLIGSGVAMASYPIAFFMPQQHARARLYDDGSAVAMAGTPEFGTGVTTAMAQVAADAIGIPLDATRFEHGDTDLPNVSSAVGSAGAMMISAAVHIAGHALRDKLVRLAVADARSPLSGADPADVEVADGRMSRRGDPASGESYGELLHRNRLADVEAVGSWTPPPPDTPHGLLTFGAQFAEVAVDADLGLVRVRRLVGAFAPGRILNERTTHSQLMGGMLWGLSQALLEGNRMDPVTGRWAATSLGDYLVPVNADAPDVGIELIEVHDAVAGPLGVKGVGEVGQVGVAAAIANAVFHATGYRVRELPITAETLLDALSDGG